MKFKITIFLSFIIVGLLAHSCNEDPEIDQLSLIPEITQNGSGTFGCLLNGEALIPTSVITEFD